MYSQVLRSISARTEISMPFSVSYFFSAANAMAFSIASNTFSLGRPFSFDTPSTTPDISLLFICHAFSVGFCAASGTLSG